MGTNLNTIPGVGKKTREDLISLGYSSVESLKGVDPEVLYQKDCRRRGINIDRCQLYVYRFAIYYAEQEGNVDPTLRWWHFKDK